MKLKWKLSLSAIATGIAGFFAFSDDILSLLERLSKKNEPPTINHSTVEQGNNNNNTTITNSPIVTGESANVEINIKP